MKLMRLLGLALVGVAVSNGVACSGSGVCEGTGGILDECKEDFSSDECEEWDDLGVNGSNWKFHGGDSCEDLGYSVECDDGGTWVRSSSDCA